jgi:hypothetical protein
LDPVPCNKALLYRFLMNCEGALSSSPEWIQVTNRKCRTRRDAANAASPNSDIFSRTPFGSGIDYISQYEQKSPGGDRRRGSRPLT